MRFAVSSRYVSDPSAWRCGGAKPNLWRTASLWRDSARTHCGASTDRTPAEGLAPRRCGSGLLLHPLLAVETDEIHRIEQEWWNAAIADRGGDDLARKREEKPRALDQYDRVHALLRDIP